MHKIFVIEKFTTENILSWYKKLSQKNYDEHKKMSKNEQKWAKMSKNEQKWATLFIIYSIRREYYDF